jgi:arylsulfate sulfotransferase
MSDGMTLVSWFGFDVDRLPQNPFVFDAFGDIRWYLDLKTHPELNQLLFENGIERLQNGDFYFGDASTDKIFEMDLFGTVINSWNMPGYHFHHNVQEKPNGNFIVSVDKIGASTVEDFIIEIDRSSKQIINTWDLNQSLQNTRRTLFSNPMDWIHVNALIYDPRDNTIFVSGRTQGLVKLDNNNKVVWIMGCHKGWGIAGNGIDLKNYLLTPLDGNDQRITNQDILDGKINHPDFEWNWYQHAPLLKPNGNIMLFDNGGTNRNFSGAGQYSRAVEYEINEENKTVKQIWEYGKSRGNATFSSIVSDVDILPNSNNIIFSPGAVNNVTRYGKVIEIDYSTKNVLFEATLTTLSPAFTVAFHRTERLNLYP